MNALLLAAVLSGLPSDELSPPPPPPAEQQFIRAPEVDLREQAPVASNGPRVAGGVTLLATGYIASIANTCAFWFSGDGGGFGWGQLLLAPVGIVVSAIPVAGPALGIIADLSNLEDTQRNLLPRMLVNVASFVAQLSGFVLLVTTPRRPKASRLAVTGFGVAPTAGGAAVGLGGSFDFPY